jgi:hypothetical protein
MRLAYCLVSCLLAIACGCTPKQLQIISENQSGQKLQNVTAWSGEKSVGFGVLINDGVKGDMSAERIFGNEIPTRMSLTFETEDGSKIKRDVEFASKSKASRKLRLVIDQNLEVTGVYE